MQRLTSAVTGSVTEAGTYDLNGNRLTSAKIGRCDHFAYAGSSNTERTTAGATTFLNGSLGGRVIRLAGRSGQSAAFRSGCRAG